MINKLQVSVIGIILTFLLSACGGGGGSVDNNDNVTVPTKVILKVSIANLPANTSLGSLQTSIELPKGVTPSVVSGNDASESAIFSTEIANLIINSDAITNLTLGSAIYTALSNTLTTWVVTTEAINSPEFVTITCSLNGTAVTASDFPTQATVTTVSDSNSNDLLGVITCPISVTFQ